MDTEPHFNDGVHVILVEPEKEGNIGSIARSIKNFGFKHLILVNPIVPLGDEARNYAVHAADVLDGVEIVRFPDGDELAKATVLKSLFKRFDIVAGTSCKIFKERTLHRIPVEIGAFIEDLSHIANLGGVKIAMVFGNERTGLPNYALNQIDQLVTIPTSDAYPSLNLAHAATICLYELSKLLATSSARGEIALAPKLKQDVFLDYFDELVTLTRIPAHKVEKTRRAFKSMVARAHVSRRELFLLMGVLRTAVDLVKTGKVSKEGNAEPCGID
jgi:tRNA/rRNA methyltransferase